MKTVKISIILACAASIVLLTSCEKKDTPVTPPKQVTTEQIPMGAAYAGQYFYKLSTNTIVSNNAREAWDMAFEAGVNGYHIYINGAKYMFAYSSGKTNFDSTYTFNVAKKWDWDAPSGNHDSTAIGEWCSFSNGIGVSNNYVYVMDRGKTSTDSAIGKVKVKFSNLDSNTYTVRYANLDGTNEHTVQIKKDANYNYVYLSLNNGGQVVNIEPQKDTWDLEFSMYTYIFYHSPPNIPIPADTLPYLVNGVLINPNGVSVAKDTLNDLPFDSVTFAFASTKNFTTIRDQIGWDWKTFQFTDDNYTLNANYKYFIKTADGKLYKLRFTDFYNKSGVKGYPTFQYLPLN